METRNLSAWSTLFLLALIWGSSFILMDFALFDKERNPTMSALQVALFRLSISGLVLLPFAIKGLRNTDKKSLFWIALVGIFGNGIPAFLFPLAQTNLASAYSGMLNTLTPFFTFLIAIVIFKTRIRKLQILGLSIGLIGTVGLIGIESDFQGGFSLKYSSLIILATICYAISVSIIHYKLKKVNSIHIAALALLFIGTPSIVYILFSGMGEGFTDSVTMQASLGYVVVLAIVGTAIALILFNKLVQKTDSIFASSVTYIIPIFAAVWGLYFGEDIGVLHLLFGAIIIVGVFLVNKK